MSLLVFLLVGIVSGTNVLLLISDDLRPELGCLGGAAITPNLDKFAASSGSIIFDRAYVQQAICCPSRSSFLTGRRPDTTRVWDLKTSWRLAGGNFTTLPEYFKTHGYRTAGMGKVFHPGYKDDVPYSWTEPYFHGNDHGLSGNMTMCWNALDHEDDELVDGQLANHAVQVMKQLKQSGSPFFLAVGVHKPHLPWDVPSKYFSLYPNVDMPEYSAPPKDYGAARPWSWDPQSGPRHCGPLNDLSPPLPEYAVVPDHIGKEFIRGYLSAVSATDRNMGVVLEALEDEGLADSTVVAFIGDHGWQLGDLGEFGKKTLFERATRAPFVLRIPDRVRAARNMPLASSTRSAALVEFVDLFPTLVDLAGLPSLHTCPEDSRNISVCTEGSSLMPLIVDPKAVAKGAVFMQYAHCMHDEGVWHDACKDPSEPRVMGYAVRTKRWRYVEWVGFTKDPPTPLWDDLRARELYDHGVDDTVDNKAESANLVEDPALTATVKQLSDLLHKGWRSV